MRRWLLTLLMTLCACAVPVRRPAPLAQLDPYFPGDRTLPWREVGRSTEGRPIYAAEFGTGPSRTLVLGGIHGNEKISARISMELAREMPALRDVLRDNCILIAPILNPDGYVLDHRFNSRGVDLNRNFPTKDWGSPERRARDNPGTAPLSESETRTVLSLIETFKPDKILALHDPLRVNNYDGPQSEGLAWAMAAHNHYPVAGYIGYPTPGSLGTWAGLDRNFAIVTLEVPTGSLETRWAENKWALVAGIRYQSTAISHQPSAISQSTKP